MVSLVVTLFVTTAFEISSMCKITSSKSNFLAKLAAVISAFSDWLEKSTGTKTLFMLLDFRMLHL
ncbi:hypothetical protein T190820D02B_30118 [Tenacibaculum sp. 190524A05c]